MRILAWLLRIGLFLALLLFAMSNTDSVNLRLWGANLVWSAPLVLFLLAFFAAGAALGLLSAVPTLLRQRREISRLRQAVQAAELAASASGGGGPIRPPIADAPPPLP
jgi:hypothetical protein